jgi:pyroglutamyl-peptidase
MAKATSAERTLITGFGPFLEVTDNPSAKIAAALGRPHLVLEVSFEAVDAFLAALDPNSFDRLVMIGVARGRDKVCPELFGRNQIGHAKDVRGADRFGPIEQGAPLLLTGTLWSPEVLGPIVDEPNISVSMNAGSYLCNYVYYRALRALPSKRIGFLHVPDAEALPLTEQIRLATFLVELTESSG